MTGDAYPLFVQAIAYGKASGLTLCRGTFGDGRSRACPLTMLGLHLYSALPWHDDTLDKVYKHLGWTVDEAMAFVAGFDGYSDPRREKYPEHSALGARLYGDWMRGDFDVRATPSPELE